jgi:hypothetical protein
VTTSDSHELATVTVGCLDAMNRTRTVTVYPSKEEEGRIVLVPPAAGGAAIFTAGQARAAGQALIALADLDDRLARAVGEPPSRSLRLVSAF